MSDHFLDVTMYLNKWSFSTNCFYCHTESTENNKVKLVSTYLANNFDKKSLFEPEEQNKLICEVCINFIETNPKVFRFKHSMGLL